MLDSKQGSVITNFWGCWAFVHSSVVWQKIGKWISVTAMSNQVLQQRYEQGWLAWLTDWIVWQKRVFVFRQEYSAVPQYHQLLVASWSYDTKGDSSSKDCHDLAEVIQYCTVCSSATLMMLASLWYVGYDHVNGSIIGFWCYHLEGCTQRLIKSCWKLDMPLSFPVL